MSHNNSSSNINNNTHHGNFNNNYHVHAAVNTTPTSTTNDVTGSYSPYHTSHHGNNNHPHHQQLPNDHLELSPEEIHDIFASVTSVPTGTANSAASIQHHNSHHLHNHHNLNHSPYNMESTLSHEDLHSLNGDGNNLLHIHDTLLLQQQNSFHTTVSTGGRSIIKHEDYDVGSGADSGSEKFTSGRDGSNNNGTMNDTSALIRTERKRSREKQRRYDVNKQFADLTAAVRQIELETEDYRVPTMYSPNNRADLIARTVVLLQSLHKMNSKKNQAIVSLQEELQRTKLAGEETAAKLKESLMSPQNLGNNKVLMMVPMMMSSNDTTMTAAGASGTNPAAAAAMPFIIPSPLMPNTAVSVPTNETMNVPVQQQSSSSTTTEMTTSSNNNNMPSTAAPIPAVTAVPMQQQQQQQQQQAAAWNTMMPWMMPNMMMLPQQQQQMMMAMMMASSATPPPPATTPLPQPAPSTTTVPIASTSVSNGIVTSGTNNTLTNITTSTTSTTMDSSLGGEQKVPSSNSINDVVGSNLAHCA
jgi:hypothetical protein